MNDTFGAYSMRCVRCQSNEATVHICTILHGTQGPHERHLCPECAQIEQRLFDVGAEPLSGGGRRVVTSLSREAEEKICEVNHRLGELDPILRRFCEHRGYEVQVDSSVWPSRGVCARGEIDRYLNLTTEATLAEILKRGFHPEMPWSLYASATPHLATGQQFRILTVDVFRALPFSGLASVLEDSLDQGYSILHGLSLEEVLARGEVPQGRPKPFKRFPW
jgi:hypothetical protein